MARTCSEIRELLLHALYMYREIIDLIPFAESSTQLVKHLDRLREERLLMQNYETYCFRTC